MCNVTLHLKINSIFLSLKKIFYLCESVSKTRTSNNILV